MTKKIQGVCRKKKECVHLKLKHNEEKAAFVTERKEMKTATEGGRRSEGRRRRRSKEV